jgi:hypothetical protein
MDPRRAIAPEVLDVIATMDIARAVIHSLQDERSVMLLALRKAAAGFAELHGQGIGCPDCRDEDDGPDAMCPAVAMVEGVLAMSEGRLQCKPTDACEKDRQEEPLSCEDEEMDF